MAYLRRKYYYRDEDIPKETKEMILTATRNKGVSIDEGFTE